MSDAQVLDRTQIGQTAFALRGYNVTNLGKTPELLAHAAYGPVVARHLVEAGEIHACATGRRVDLVERIRDRAESTLETYSIDIANVVAVELAQLHLLREFHGIDVAQGQLLTGYSLGEAAAVAAAGVFSMEAVLTPLLKLADDAASLGHDVWLGVLFSRGPVLDLEQVTRHCLHISARGAGVIGVSSYLSPNTVLLMGQGNTIDVFKDTMHEVLPKAVHLKKNQSHWPPMHTAIVRQRQIPDRASVLLATSPGGFVEPKPPVLSHVTGTLSYNDYNAREILTDWVDHPQQVWKIIEYLVSQGVEQIVHVGPEPNILPATFRRLSIDVAAQLEGRGLAGLSLRAVSALVRRRRWLMRMVSSNAALLRVPHINQVNLEDWLLEQPVA